MTGSEYWMVWPDNAAVSVLLLLLVAELESVVVVVEVVVDAAVVDAVDEDLPAYEAAAT